MIKAERTVVIDRPIEEVFAFVTDQTNTPRWQAGLVELERTTPGPIGVGTKHKGARVFMGRRLDCAGGSVCRPAQVLPEQVSRQSHCC